MEPMLEGLQQESPIPCQRTTGVGPSSTCPAVRIAPDKNKNSASILSAVCCDRLTNIVENSGAYLANMYACDVCYLLPRQFVAT